MQDLIENRLKILKDKNEFGTSNDFLLSVTKEKFQQMNEISNEILKFKLGLTEYTCKLRNYLHILAGEMELYYGIDVNNEVEELAAIIEKKNVGVNWDKIIGICLSIYEKIYNFC